MSNVIETGSRAELEALPIDALRTKAREVVGGGSWVVKATKVQLAEYILRRFGPTEVEKANLAAGNKAYQPSTNGSNGSIPAVAVEVTSPAGPSAADLSSAIGAAVVSALASFKAPAAVSDTTIAEAVLNSPVVKEHIAVTAQKAVKSDLGLIGERIDSANYSIGDVQGVTKSLAKLLGETATKVASFEASIASLNAAKVVEVKTPNVPAYKAGPVHFKFPKLLFYLNIGSPVWLAGPAGSGKTEAVHKAADALGLGSPGHQNYYPISVSQQTSKSDLFGYINPGTGTLVRTALRDAYEYGGVLLLDEIDAGNSNVLTSLNSAVSNGGATFPDGYVKKHQNFRIVGTANTWGLGASREYVGRNQIDAASLSRFAKIAWDYDEGFELAISSNEKWTKHVQALRHAAFELKERVVISPRASIGGGIALDNGESWADVEEAFITGGVSPDIIAKIKSKAGVK